MSITKRTSGGCNCRGMVKTEPTQIFTAKDRGSYINVTDVGRAHILALGLEIFCFGVHLKTHTCLFPFPKKCIK